MSARWFLVGWIVTALLGALALVTITISAHGLLGGTNESRIECDRATGDCRASFTELVLTRQRRARIADIVSAEIQTYDRKIDYRSREAQSYVSLKLKDAELRFSPMSAETETVANYEVAVTQIQAFLARKEPALMITIKSRNSGESNLILFGSGILLLFMAVAGIIKLKGRRK